jgi:bifunctional UDP-N-acetylglucosamine pyrophosphorylase/glucosamine-1-phosphate N-acetyltransferase
MAPRIQAIVLAAGRGTRMHSERPKVLHEIFNRPLLDYPLEALRALGIRKPLVVVGWGREEILKHLNGHATPVVQSPQLGTGHAVQVTRRKVGRFGGDLLIWPADMTLVRKETIATLLKAHRTSGAWATILSSFLVDPTGYGRIVRRGGRAVDIREELDASPAEKRIHEVNTGVYLFKREPLFRALEKIKPTNQKKEYYLTDTIRLIDEAGGRVEALPYASPEEALGINSQADLAQAVKALNQHEIRKHQMQGVTIVSPEQTFIAPDVRIGPETVIHPWTYIERGVKIGKKVSVGPFAKIRSGSVIEDEAVIGSFVEIVRSRIGKKVYAKHLAYLGDAVIGEGANIGAGVITANFDGKRKNRTRIGKKAFIGVDTLFVAPVEVGDQAKTGAGAVLTRGTKVKRGEVFVGIPAKLLKRKRKA